MTEQDLKDNIYDWLKSVLSTLWAGENDADDSARPDGTIEFVWHMEDESRVKTPFLEGRISNMDRIGWDESGSPDKTTASVTYQGDREVMLYLDIRGSGAMDNLNMIRNATQDTTQAPNVKDNGFCFVQCGPVIDAHTFIGPMPEDRALMDIRLRYVESWTTRTGAPGIIEEVQASGKIDGKAVVPNQDIKAAA